MPGFQSTEIGRWKQADCSFGSNSPKCVYPVIGKRNMRERILGLSEIDLENIIPSEVKEIQTDMHDMYPV